MTLRALFAASGFAASLLAASLLALTPAPVQAEGFFRASLEAVDLGAWPEVRVLLRLEDEGSESGLDDSTALPNPYSKIDCPARACWRVKQLEESGVPVTLRGQVTAPIQARSAEQFLWLRYHSNRPQPGEAELQIALETSYGGNRTAADQPELPLLDATDTDLIRLSPWPYLAKRWDVFLNQEFQAVRDNIPPEARAALIQAQRAWIRYRDAFCALAGSTQSEGHAQCIALRTVARSVELQTSRHNLDGLYARRRQAGLGAPVPLQ
ncbi:DUF1311 domain-containing protein [Pigmentiphaga aceris]|uniref:DUF1311 domain-containing protein n=1 Tax=Pigmentiphaga aceris TaxID=1940612 RepID=A0A5C0B0V8_9BURK|nr:lysozyme inhibitor LprI family protein [Pigmentiphaga aceris]QEI06481.1 DUF1311 domain-containing protein [Pigmentiphaga aceris]